MKKNVHVIHHTHWDFEWYFTNNESFVQLTYHLDEVMQALEDNLIDFYLLDGQMSLLDDYLQVFPEQQSRIKKLVEAQKLSIGPWYTQTDELIVAGESIVRNLTLGMELAEQLGGYMPIGYLPDSFGQSQDMPKIYNGVGFDKTVFWRGVPNEITEKREFNWRSPDGSEVTAINIKDGYFVGVGLIYSDDAQGLMRTIDTGSTGDQLVLPVGGDQRYVDYNLRDRIDRYNEELADYHLEESTYEAVFSALDSDKLPTVSGEFISSSVSKIHRSIYSSRYDHKYMNDKIERRLIYQLEPLMLMAKNQGIAYKQGLLDKIWKLLNKNQAHDGAGGCNSDKTNKIILDRYTEADQLSYSAVDYLTRKIAESTENVQENDLFFFNPLPKTVRKNINFEVSVPTPTFRLSYQGENLDYQLLSTKKEYNGSIRRNMEDTDKSKFYYIHRGIVSLDLPANSFIKVVVSPTELVEVAEKTTNSSVRKNSIATNIENCNVQNLEEVNEELIELSDLNEQSLIIENQYFTVSYVQGKIDVYDKCKQMTYHDCIKIEDSGDEGDTYDYSPPYTDMKLELTFDTAMVTCRKGKLQQQLTLSGSWKLPLDLTARAEKKINGKNDYCLTLSLMAESKQLQCHLTIDNQVKDHRMRVLFATEMNNNYSYTDTPFGTISRPVEDPHLHDWQQLNWREEPTSIFPMLHWVNAHNDQRSITLFSKGIKEYQFVGANYQDIALTLFRSVGYLGRPELLRRPGAASGNEFKSIPTPDSQLQQKLTFKFALQIAEEYNPSDLVNEYMNYAVTIPFYQIQELNRFTTTLKYFVSNPLLKQTSVKRGVSLKSDTIVYSTYKLNRTGNHEELRVYNPRQEVVEDSGYIALPQTMTCWETNLVGEAITTPRRQKKIELGTFAPGEIKTIAIK